jgi:hypothetical protein
MSGSHGLVFGPLLVYANNNGRAMDAILEKSDETHFANGQNIRDLRVSPDLRNNKCGRTGEPTEIPHRILPVQQSPCVTLDILN